MRPPICSVPEVSSLASIHQLCSRHDWGEVDDRLFMSELLSMTTRAIGCTRVGVRAVVGTLTGKILRTVAMYDQFGSCFLSVPDLVGAGVEPYLECLARQGGVIVPDVRSSLRLLPLMHGYVETQGVRSLMDTGISIDGMVYGAITCEDRCSVQLWSPRQLHLLRQIAVRASPGLVRLMALRPPATSFLDASEYGSAPRPADESVNRSRC